MARRAPGALLTIFETPDLTIDQGREAARRIIALPQRSRPDRIFAGNDLLALGMLVEFELAGVKVPDDIALISYDDIDYARTAVVPLTSVRQPRTQIAEESIQFILDEEDRGHAHQHTQRRLVPELVIRASTTG